MRIGKRSNRLLKRKRGRCCFGNRTRLFLCWINASNRLLCTETEQLAFRSGNKQTVISSHQGGGRSINDRCPRNLCRSTVTWWFCCVENISPAAINAIACFNVDRQCAFLMPRCTDRSQGISNLAGVYEPTGFKGWRFGRSVPLSWFWFWLFEDVRRNYIISLRNIKL